MYGNLFHEETCGYNQQFTMLRECQWNHSARRGTCEGQDKERQERRGVSQINKSSLGREPQTAGCKKLILFILLTSRITNGTEWGASIPIFLCPVLVKGLGLMSWSCPRYPMRSC